MKRDDTAGTSAASGTVTRRELLAAAGGALVVAALPLRAQAGVAERPAPALLEDWHVDDQWTGYPRNAEPIGCARAAAVEPPAGVAAVDAAFVALT